MSEERDDDFELLDVTKMAVFEAAEQFVGVWTETGIEFYPKPSADEDQA